MTKFSLNKTAGLSLIEIIVAIAIFAFISSAIITMSLGSLSGILRSEQSMGAVALAQEGLEATRAMRNYGWNSLKEGVYGLSDAGGYFQFSGSSDTNAGYTRSITVTDINSTTKEIAVNVQWKIIADLMNTLKITTRLTNWLETYWLQTIFADFDRGLKNSVVVTNKTGGEIELSKAPDFRNASISATYDFKGSGDVSDLMVEGNRLYVIFIDNDADEGFIGFDISDISNGNLTKIGSTRLGTDAKKMALKNGYAYIATTDNTKEIVVVRLSDYAKVKTINIPSSANATGVFVLDNTLYLTTAKSSSEELYVFDITNPEGDIPLLTAVELNTDAKYVFVSNGYAYISTSNDAKELIVVRLSDYAVVNSYDIPGNADATTVSVSENQAYIGTKNNSGGPEFYIIDIPSPEGEIKLNGAIEIGNHVTDFYRAGNTVYATTHAGGSEELAILDAAGRTVTSWIDLLGGPNADAIWLSGAYLYVGTNNNSDTIQIVKGSTEAGTSGYTSEGFFTSAAFNSGSDATSYKTLNWTQKGNGTVKFQLRTAGTEADLSNAVFTGPDATNKTYYSTPGSEISIPGGSGKRWVQYQAVLGGDSVSTPVLEDTIINYAK